MRKIQLNSDKAKLRRAKIENGISLKVPAPTIVHKDKKKELNKKECRK